MKLLRITPIISTGAFPQTNDLQAAQRAIEKAIAAIRWPEGANDFAIYPESGKKPGKGNGVKPIRNAFVRALVDAGWQAEKEYRSRPKGGPVTHDPGAFDAWVRTRRGFPVAVEWETGNISSSHRAMNKMALALLEGHLAGGFLVLPSRELYRYLTDRVGNYQELEPYFPLWRSLRVREGLLAVVEVEHDRTSWRVRRIAKGTDGRSRA